MGTIRVHGLSALVLFFISALGVSAFAAPDAFRPGPFPVASGAYKLPAAVDPDVMAGAKTELWAKVFYPRPDRRQGPRVRPLLMLLHGNHATCRRIGSTSSSDCTYTREGVCPAGHEVVPNHEGYNYAAQHLASHGFIVVSINANRGITCGFGESGDFGLNLARGKLILRHLEKWSLWSRSGGAPETIGAGPDGFVGAVDFSQVGLMGHSRGGEGARAAYNLHLDAGSVWPARIPNLKIRGIFEIGAVDGQTSRTLDADNVAWNQLVPMCDGDVTGHEGRLPFERMILKTTEQRRSPKSLALAWGMNHNFFNTEWNNNDSYGCHGHDPVYGPGPTSEAQKNLARHLMSAFFIGHVGAERSLETAQLFDPQYSVPTPLTSITRVERDFIPTSDALFAWRFEEFDQPTGTNTHRVPNEAGGITIVHESGTPAHARVAWTTADVGQFLQLNWTVRGQGKGLPAAASLDFRVRRQEAHLSSRDATDFSIQLIGGNDTRSAALPASRYSHILGPASDSDLYQTVRIPISEFGVPADFKLRGVRFVFDRSAKGAILLANVRLSALSIPALDDAAPELLTRANHDFEPAPAHRSRSLQRAVPIREYTAELKAVRFPTGNLSVNSRRQVEIVVESPTEFPVQNQLPTLVMAGRKFSLSRYAGEGIGTLVFSLTPEELAELPEKGPMHVQYGRNSFAKLWRLTDYDKSRFSR